MRLDKYIWAVRLYKTRSMATKDCQKGRVKANGQESKPGKDISSGDKIEIKDLALWRSYKVLTLPKSRVGAKLVPDHLTETTSAEILEQLEEIRSVNRARDAFYKGKGRPTKRDRRDLDDLVG